MYVICSHFQSGVGQESVDLRQRQADSIASLIRDAKSPGGEITLSADTPFLVLGDLNVIDNPSHSLATLLSGDILNEAEFGPDAAPDWDGSSLTDLLPRHNGSRADFYTWRDDTQPFPPGALDRILYTDSMLAVRRAFVLNTMAMTSNELRRAGLRATDVMRDPAKGVHDHLPVVADLVLETGVSKRSHSTP